MEWILYPFYLEGNTLSPYLEKILRTRRSIQLRLVLPPLRKLLFPTDIRHLPEYELHGTFPVSLNRSILLRPGLSYIFVRVFYTGCKLIIDRRLFN